MLDQTLIIVTSDHGEGLGEHDLFDHGESLYRTESACPWSSYRPRARVRSTVVDETVSLRDLPATIVDLVGREKGRRFPANRSPILARSPPWSAGWPREQDPVISELMASNPDRPNQGRSPASRGPLISLAERGFVYIRNDGDGSEQLFNERDDPQEIDDRAKFPSMRAVPREIPPSSRPVEKELTL